MFFLILPPVLLARISGSVRDPLMHLFPFSLVTKKGGLAAPEVTSGSLGKRPV